MTPQAQDKEMQEMQEMQMPVILAADDESAWRSR
jgi:hypothetical protein